MNKLSYELQVLVNGKPVKEYIKDGRTFVEGRKKTNYTLKFKNNTGSRILAIFSVDGIDVLKGGKAAEASSGYIVSGYDSVEIKGFRISDDKVAQFVFDDPENSYAELSNLGGNTGVIGVRLYAEQVKYGFNGYDFGKYRPLVSTWDYSHKIGDAVWCIQNSNSLELRQFNSVNLSSVNLNNLSAESIQRSEVSASSFDLGTAWGDEKVDRVTKVDFEKGNHITDLEILYSSRKGLGKLGIDFRDDLKVNFPKSFGGEYCKPPKKR